VQERFLPESLKEETLLAENMEQCKGWATELLGRAQVKRPSGERSGLTIRFLCAEAL
jgi:hypothetical protein